MFPLCSVTTTDAVLLPPRTDLTTDDDVITAALHLVHLITDGQMVGWVVEISRIVNTTSDAHPPPPPPHNLQLHNQFVCI